MKYEVKDIEKILPHRYPFLMVDRIESVEPGKSAIGYKCVSVNEPYFSGHFPGNPIMPGVMIVESLAQVGAFTMLVLPENKGKLIFFAGIKEAKFRKKVIPGDVLRLETIITRVIGKLGFGKGIATSQDEIVCQVELMFGIE